MLLFVCGLCLPKIVQIWICDEPGCNYKRTVKHSVKTNDSVTTTQQYCSALLLGENELHFSDENKMTLFDSKFLNSLTNVSCTEEVELLIETLKPTQQRNSTAYMYLEKMLNVNEEYRDCK